MKKSVPLKEGGKMQAQQTSGSRESQQGPCAKKFHIAVVDLIGKNLSVYI